MLMCCCVLLFFFFFSSRRRHTRFDCDWSSDVCSSDLNRLFATPAIVAQSGIFARPRADREGGNGHKNEAAGRAPPLVIAIPALPLTDRRARPPRPPGPTPPWW